MPLHASICGTTPCQTSPSKSPNANKLCTILATLTHSLDVSHLHTLVYVASKTWPRLKRLQVCQAVAQIDLRLDCLRGIWMALKPQSPAFTTMLVHKPDSKLECSLTRMPNFPANALKILPFGGTAADCRKVIEKHPRLHDLAVQVYAPGTVDPPPNLQPPWICTTITTLRPFTCGLPLSNILKSITFPAFTPFTLPCQGVFPQSAQCLILRKLQTSPPCTSCGTPPGPSTTTLSGVSSATTQESTTCPSRTILPLNSQWPAKPSSYPAGWHRVARHATAWVQVAPATKQASATTF